MNCDVVLVISNMGQFLTAEDMDLLSTKLDEEAVNSAYIIGSQLDSALRQLPKHIKSLQEAYKNCTNTMERRANEEIKKALRIHPESALLQALERQDRNLYLRWHSRLQKMGKRQKIDA